MGGSLDDCSTSEFSFGNLYQSLVESLGKPSARMAVIQRIEEVLQALFLVKFARSNYLCVRVQDKNKQASLNRSLGGKN